MEYEYINVASLFCVCVLKYVTSVTNYYAYQPTYSFVTSHTPIKFKKKMLISQVLSQLTIFLSRLQTISHQHTVTRHHLHIVEYQLQILHVPVKLTINHQMSDANNLRSKTQPQRQKTYKKYRMPVPRTTILTRSQVVKLKVPLNLVALIKIPGSDSMEGAGSLLLPVIWM